MENSIILLMILSLFLGAGCWLFFVWGVKKGEFDDVERAKHRMLDDEEPARKRGNEIDRKHRSAEARKEKP
jgi:cbb3-type cytochrome oxidase maturation protein